LGRADIITSAHGYDDLYLALTVVWLTGFTLLVGLWLRRRRQFAKAVKTGKLVTTGREAEALRRAQGRLGIAREIRLVLSPALVEPGVCGTRKPVVILPEGIADHLNDDELEAVAMHEVAHVGRWDNAVGNLQRLLCCALWFHPCVWLVERRLLVERERACDEEVVKVSGRAATYASGILKVCRFCLGWKVAGVSGMAGANLRERIVQITSHKVDQRLKPSHRLAFSFVAAFLIIFSIVGAEFGQRSINAQAQAQAPSADASANPAGESAGGSAENSLAGRSYRGDGVRAQGDKTVVKTPSAAQGSGRTEAPSGKDVPPDSVRDEAAAPASRPNGLGQRAAKQAPRNEPGEFSEADIDELKRRAVAEHADDADDANIVIVVNKNKQVSTNTATVAKSGRP